MSLTAIRGPARGECWTRAYWLEHCEGYGVDSPDRRIGYVEKIVRAEGSGDPTELLVHAGNGAERRRFAVPIDRIREIRPASERILVDPEAALAGPAAAGVTVGEVMHAGLIICGPESPARHAARLMARNRVHAVVVLGDDEEGGLWGIVSDRDLVDAVATGEVGAGSAGSMARMPLVTVTRDDSLAHAARLMHDHAATHLLVVGAGGRPVGMLSTLDVVAAAAAGLTDAPPSRAGAR